MRVKWVKFVRKHRPDFKDPSDFQVHCALLGALRGRLLRVQIIGDWYNRAEWESKYPRLYKEDRCAHEERYCCSCSSRRSSQWSNERTSKPNICDIKTYMFDQLRSTCIQWYKLILFGRLSPPYCWYIEKHRHTSFIVLVITRVKDGARMGFRCYLMTDYDMCFSNKSLDINMQILLLSLKSFFSLFSEWSDWH